MYRWTAVVASLLPAPLLAAPAEPSTHPRQRLVRVDAPRVSVAPVPMGRGGYGLAAMGTF
jgi:hypothetical protein